MQAHWLRKRWACSGQQLPARGLCCSSQGRCRKNAGCSTCCHRGHALSLWHLFFFLAPTPYLPPCLTPPSFCFSSRWLLGPHSLTLGQKQGTLVQEAAQGASSCSHPLDSREAEVQRRQARVTQACLFSSLSKAQIP